MCSFAVSNRKETWEEMLKRTHKGERHKLSKMIQEEQGEIDCYV